MRLLIFIFVVLLSQNCYPQDKLILTKKEKNNLKNISDSYRVTTLKNLYTKNSKNGVISFNHTYLIDLPLNYKDLLNFEHPYLKKKLSELTKKDIKEINESISEDYAKNARNQSILNTAIKYGMHSALYKTALDYKKILQVKKHDQLMQIFPFDLLMVADGKIKPPLIEEISYSKKIENKRTIRTIKKRFQIVKQSEVILVAPTYLDFFKNLNIKKPKDPQVFLLPINKEERVYWRKGIVNGWVEGVKQAHKIIRYDYKELTRTMLGYIRFFALYDRGVVSMPTHRNLNVGTNSRGDVVNIGENIFEITELPQLNDNEQNWLALPQVDDIFNKVSEQDLLDLTAELNDDGAL